MLPGAGVEVTGVIAMSRVAKGPVMGERRLPNRDRHRILPVLRLAELYGVRCLDLSPPVKDTDDMEGETTEHQA